MDYKTEYDRKTAFDEFERCYKYAYAKIAEPKKWLVSRELEVLGRFDEVVRAELDKKRERDDDVLTIHFSVKSSDGAEKTAIRVMVYWLIEMALSECPLAKRWGWSDSESKSRGESFTETQSQLVVDWKVDLKKFYSKEVWK